MGRETGFSQRSSKLTSRAFVETLLVSCLNEDMTYEAQCDLLKLKKITITKQSFTDHLNSIQADALHLQDLGYFCITSFKKIMDGKAYFLSRYLF